MNQKIKDLESKILYYDKSYREGQSEISDSEYDKLLDKLKDLDPTNHLFKTGIIQQSVSSTKEELPIYMGSLDKLKTVEEVLDWIKSKNLSPNTVFIITGKFDGISLVVNEETKPKKCWTRGSGKIGHRVDDHFQFIQFGKSDGNGLTYGEAIITHEEFKKYSDLYANPRNMVAGLFNPASTPNPDLLKSVVYARYGSTNTNDKSKMLNEVDKLNYIQLPHARLQIKDINENILTIMYNKYLETFPVDGLVIDIVDENLRNELGSESNDNPAYSRAIKLTSWQTTTTTIVSNIKWEVSKNGKLKPVIEIDPVTLSGAVISNVTGYNARYISDNNITKGSKIEIVRSGEVIPKHLNTFSYDEDRLHEMWEELTECPSCGEPTRWDENMVELCCGNSKCKEMIVNKLAHFFNVLEVEEFGKPTIQKLYDIGFHHPYDILGITLSEFVELDGLGQTMFKTISTQFETLFEGVPLSKLLHALNIFNGKMGSKTCQLIFDNYNMDQYLIDSQSDRIEKLTNIHGVSDITAQVFITGIETYTKLYSTNPLIKITYVATPTTNPNGKFSGMNICFTGFRDKHWEKLVIDDGGRITSGVSKNTTHLIVKDLNTTSGKMLKAQTLKIEIMDRKMFEALLVN